MTTTTILLGLFAVFVGVVIVLAACRGLFSGLWPEDGWDEGEDR